jgi:hypothetical protein
VARQCRPCGEFPRLVSARSLLGLCLLAFRGQVRRCVSNVTCHTSHVTRHTSHVTHHTSHVTRHTSHVTRHTSHVTRHTPHVTRHTSFYAGSSRVGVMRRSASGAGAASNPSNKSPPAPSAPPKAYRIVCARDRTTKRFSVPPTCSFEQFRTACCNSHVSCSSALQFDESSLPLLVCCITVSRCV